MFSSCIDFFFCMRNDKVFIIKIMFSYFFRAKTLRTPSNIFVVNLAILDTIMLIKSPIMIYNSFYQGYALGHQACRIFGITGSFSGIGASATNAAIAYDRYRYRFTKLNKITNFSVNQLIIINLVSCNVPSELGYKYHINKSKNFITEQQYTIKHTSPHSMIRPHQ